MTLADQLRAKNTDLTDRAADALDAQDAELARLRAVLQLIAENGGVMTDAGVVCNGGWCAEQARRATDTNSAESAPDESALPTIEDVQAIYAAAAEGRKSGKVFRFETGQRESSIAPIAATEGGK